MNFDPKRAEANARAASTEDLLDRVTVYRADLEPAALPIILTELRSRGVDAASIVAHEVELGDVLCDATGSPRPCSFCRRPAIEVRWAWHRMFGKVPLFPWRYRWCEIHNRPGAVQLR